MAFSSQLSLHEIGAKRPDLVMISPSDPDAMNQLVRECQELGLAYIYDPSQQIVRLCGDDVRSGIQGASALFVNDYEFALIEKCTGWDAAEIRQRNPALLLVVTRGEKGATIDTAAGHHSVPIVPAERIVDPTGVGDAFRGGFLTGLRLDLDLLTCGQMGALAATYCLEQMGTQGHCYTPAEFVQRFRQHFDDGGKLDILLREQ
jgi:adenosine kinase